VRRWGEREAEYEELAEWISVRRGARGARTPMMPSTRLLLCEILAEDAVKKITERLRGRPFTPVAATAAQAAVADEPGFLAHAASPSLRLGSVDLGSKIFPVHLWDADHVENRYIDHPESDHGVELLWVPPALPHDLLSKLVSEIEAQLKVFDSATQDSNASQESNGVANVMRETHRRLTEEGSNAYPRLAGSPQTVRENHRVTLQVPIGPSTYGVALIREKNLELPTAQELGSRHILNSLAVRVAYVYQDANRQRLVEFQERQERENATYGGAWDVSAAGYIDPQRHEDPRVPGRVSPWQACACELAEELQIPPTGLPHRDNYYFFGVGTDDPTGQVNLLAYCLGSYVPDPKRTPSALVKSYDRCVLQPEAVAAFVRRKRHWVPTALLTLVFTLEACGYTRRRIQEAFATCAGVLDLSP